MREDKTNEINDMGFRESLKSYSFVILHSIDIIGLTEISGMTSA
jgi:hypothetical protein